MKQRARCWLYAGSLAIIATLMGCLVMTKDENIRSVIYGVIGTVFGGSGMFAYDVFQGDGFQKTSAGGTVSTSESQRRLDTHERYIDQIYIEHKDLEKELEVHKLTNDAHK